MFDFDVFFTPPIALIGSGSIKRVPKKINDLHAETPLIVTDKGIVATGILKQLTDILDTEGMKYAVFDGTVPNPTDSNVLDGVAIYKAKNCDSIITLGGGSAHDCGKGIGIIVSNGGDICDYEGINKVKIDLPAYVAINTTAGTASEITRFCIITDSKRKVKMSIIDWHLTPKIAINDPMLMIGMPPSLTAATGMDALTHAIEAYVSTNSTPITDACAERSMRLIALNLRTAVTQGGNVVARNNMCYAQYLAGMAFNNAGLGYVHAMAHQLGGMYNLPHGECNAILLPHVESYNLSTNYRKFYNIARLFDRNINELTEEEAAPLAIDAIKELSAYVGIPSNIRNLAKRYKKEVSMDDIPMMVKNAQKDACAMTNPCPISEEDITKLFKAAF